MRVLVSITAAVLTVLVAANATAPETVSETSSPPVLKNTDFVLDGKTTYCYLVREGFNYMLFNLPYTVVLAEGKSEWCPVQVALEQTTTGDVVVNENVAYNVMVTIDKPRSFLFGDPPVFEKPVEDPISKKMVQISSASLHACSSSSVCDAFRPGNNSHSSPSESAIFTDGKAVFALTLNFTTPETYTVFAVVILPHPSSLDATVRFVAYTSTVVRAKSSAGDDSMVATNAPKVPPPSSTSAKKSLAASTTTTAVTTAVGVVVVAAGSLLV